MDASHVRARGGAATGPLPVDRRKTGSKHHLITEGGDVPLKVFTTAANVNDVTQTLALADDRQSSAEWVTPANAPTHSSARRQGLRQQAKSCELRKRGILPVISRKSRPDIQGLGKLHCVVEQTFTSSATSPVRASSGKRP
ncbi:hypothetical protein ACIGCZ_35690 [Streptomyces nigra]|uniref:hypothetical protein n=1 Tax=Streptomyces nigra TaxID=1827580 RepID=UPI0037D3DFBE